MIIWLIQNLFYLRSVFRTHDTPRQMAAGVALGLCLGLIPKGNLLAAVVCGAILATRVNLGSAMLAALVTSVLAPLADPLTHPIGWMLLTPSMLRPFWLRVYGLPLAPWTAFNNTVVLGNFVLGLLLTYPTYRWALPHFERWQASKMRPPATQRSQDSAEVTAAVVVGSQEASAVEPSTAARSLAELPPEPVESQALRPQSHQGERGKLLPGGQVHAELAADMEAAVIAIIGAEERAESHVAESPPAAERVRGPLATPTPVQAPAPPQAPASPAAEPPAEPLPARAVFDTACDVTTTSLANESIGSEPEAEITELGVDEVHASAPREESPSSREQAIEAPPPEEPIDPASWLAPESRQRLRQSNQGKGVAPSPCLPRLVIPSFAVPGVKPRLARLLPRASDLQDPDQPAGKAA